jgi:hypothetical protein
MIGKKLFRTVQRRMLNKISLRYFGAHADHEPSHAEHGPAIDTH